MNRNNYALGVILKAFWFLVLIMLCVLGCSREPSGPASAQTNSSSGPPKTDLIPLTNMVLIKAGTFRRLKHSVTISRDFWLGKYEVTQAEYAGLMGKNPSHFKDKPDAPVEKISYFDAMAYCSALTQRERQAGRLPTGYEYRLPTEAEWEYACRAGTTNQFSFGDTATDADQYAWTWENSGGSTHPVGQKRPNPWGLHDIHGNVWEWCLDWFTEYPATDTIDPAGPAQGKFKVFRGGGWNNDALFARSANRFMMAPANGIHFVGFRATLSQTRDP
jgi:formylglycine-generating enzyme required for sulfatase activity